MSTLPLGAYVGTVKSVYGECYVIPYNPSLTYSGLTLASQGQYLYLGDTLACYNGGTITASFPGALLTSSDVVELTVSNTGPFDANADIYSVLSFLGRMADSAYADFVVPFLGDTVSALADSFEMILDTSTWGAYLIDLDSQPWWYDGYEGDYYDAGGISYSPESFDYVMSGETPTPARDRWRNPN